MKPLRFQVNKRVEQALEKHHPWIFRRQCSTALDGVPVGSLLRIVGTQNQCLGIGIFDPLGAIAVRIFEWNDTPLNEAYWMQKITDASARRRHHIDAQKLSGYRLLHGEGDSFPGITLDIYGSTAVINPYLTHWFPLLIIPLQRTLKKYGIRSLLLKTPRSHTSGEWLMTMMKSKPSGSQLAYDLMTETWRKFEEPIWFREGGIELPSFPLSGAKTGFFLDLRPVRQWLLQQDLRGKNVLNLFANSGAFSAIAHQRGAETVTSVETRASGREEVKILFERWKLPFSEENWKRDDVWSYLEEEKRHTTERYDLIIIDPPSLATKKIQRSQLSNTWTRLHQLAIPLLNPNGQLISISCTDRLTEIMQKEATLLAFKQCRRRGEIEEVFHSSFDHPPLSHLRERDYFRTFLWKS